MRKAIPFAVLVVVGCRIVQVPAQLKGDTTVHLHNSLSRPLCDFSLTPVGAAVASGNWMQRPVDLDVQFSVKPGTYLARVGCGTQFHGEAQITLGTRVTEIDVGTAPTSVPPNATELRIAVTGDVGANRGGGGAPAGPQCMPDGSTLGDLTGPPCCSHLVSKVGDVWQCCTTGLSPSDAQANGCRAH